jgi:hypothetical protein
MHKCHVFLTVVEKDNSLRINEHFCHVISPRTFCNFYRFIYGLQLTVIKITVLATA